MKKTIRIKCALLAAFMLAAAIPALSGCERQASINVYNWGEYIDMDTLAQFTSETGIRVNYTTYTTNEMLYSKIKSGGGEYDVIFPSDYMIGRMIKEDMLEPLDYSNIPNAANIDAMFEDDVYTPYSVPYTWGTVGIVYNRAIIGGLVDGWGAMFDEKNKDGILMFANSRDAIAVALLYLGHSLNTTDRDELQQAADLLREQKPLVQAYVMDEIFDKMAGGEASIGAYYAGDIVTMMEENDDLIYCMPKEGTNVFVDSMCIPKNAVNKKEAEMFINFMCRDDISVRNAAMTNYAVPSSSAKALLPEYIRDNPIIYPSEEALQKCERFALLPDDILELYDDIWVKLRS